ncbi:MAG TPA: hypothetical protein VMU71_02835 [Terracidiphilus sp.]|nr:hypothetical protein [Terracidiphilus sp.]
MRTLIIGACILIAGAAAVCQQSTAAGKPVESEHIAGPHGLEGWTMNGPIPDDYNHENYPFELVIARRGKIIHRIEGGAFVWRWIFWDDGRKVAYEAGPLHFGLACNLYDLAKGRDIASFDCFHGVPDNAPPWLEALESSR